MLSADDAVITRISHTFDKCNVRWSTVKIYTVFLFMPVRVESETADGRAAICWVVNWPADWHVNAQSATGGVSINRKRTYECRKYIDKDTAVSCYIIQKTFIK